MNKSLHVVLKLLGGAAFLAIVLWLGGMFDQPGVGAGVLAGPAGQGAPQHTSRAELQQKQVEYRAVGTIESRSRVQVASRIPGQFLRLDAEVGDTVREGDLLALIDSRDSDSRVAQARSALLAAEARDVQASAAAKRVLELSKAEAATQVQLESAVAAAASAAAGVTAARERVEEALIHRSYARITAPIDGVVALRSAETGDMAWPGAPVFTLLDPDNLRIEAWVRESALGDIQLGHEYTVQVPSLSLASSAVIEEILPSADTRSRSFLVRAPLIDAVGKGLHAGMFARLLVPAGSREIVAIESAAVRRFGQLETVLVQVDGQWSRRYLTLGKVQGDRVEVLSGLTGGEMIGWGE